MHSSYRPIVDLLIKFFTVIGLSPTKRSFLHGFPMVFVLIITTTITILVFLQLLHNKMSIDTFVDFAESISICAHIFTKFTCMFVNRTEIRKVFRDVSKFWSLEHFDPKFQKEYIQRLKTMEFTIKTFLLFITFAIIFLTSSPLILGRLTIICYVPQFLPGPAFALYNSGLYMYGGFGVITFDFFVCTITLLLHLQYKIMNKRIELLKLEETEMCLNEMTVIIDYHNFLCRFLKRFNSIIAFTLLVEFVPFSLLTCLGMYIFTDNLSNFTKTAKSLLYISGSSFELLICFCIPSTILNGEASKTVQVLYESKWYETSSTSIKKNIQIMMAKSQQVTALWAGSLFVINLETCTEAFKKSLSFYACLRTLRDKI